MNDPFAVHVSESVNDLQKQVLREFLLKSSSLPNVSEEVSSDSQFTHVQNVFFAFENFIQSHDIWVFELFQDADLKQDLFTRGLVLHVLLVQGLYRH